MPLLTTPALADGSLAGREQPLIAGDGVRLRPWAATDRQAVVAAYADPAIQRWHCNSMDDDEALTWIARWAQRWKAETAASWAVVADGHVAGQAGLRRVDLEEGVAEISYWVVPAARGQRIAPRALGALTGWAFGTLGLHRLGLHHSTANPASCRVAEQGGYLLEGTMRGSARHADGWHDMHVHARLATDPAL
jgi:ribosomal-protein-alanine N-acetyltransferase